MEEIKRISILGAGRVGSNLAHFLNKTAYIYVWNRSPEKALKLESDNCKAITNIEDLPASHLYLISVSDAAIPIVADALLPFVGKKAIVAHTSGTTRMEVLIEFGKKRAVFYPLQTFDNKRINSLEGIPFLIETKTQKNQETLENLASDIGGIPQYAGSKEREQIHLAAVIACNLTMELWHISKEHLKSEGIEPDILNTLINQTVKNMMSSGPDRALTGPAVRGDMTTLLRHLRKLDDTSVKAIFSLLNERIYIKKNSSSS